MIGMRLAALSLALVALTSACSNPRCWHSDGSEGECTSGHPRVKSQAELEADAKRRDTKALAANEEPCAAGDPSACDIVAPIKESRNAPAKEIETAYAVACSSNRKFTKWDRNSSCRKAGEYAERPGGGGRGAALQRFTRGCVRYDAVACVNAARIDPSQAVAYTTEACRLDHRDSCVDVVKNHADSTHPEHRDFMVLGCMHSIDDACDLLGRLEVIAREREVGNAIGGFAECKQGERNACIRLGEDAARR
jgi:hypothetical protein